jgi:hypothetical protein
MYLLLVAPSSEKTDYLAFQTIDTNTKPADRITSQNMNRLSAGNRLCGKIVSYVAATSSPPRLHHASLSGEVDLRYRRTLMKISPHAARSASRNRIEKKIPIITSYRFAEGAPYFRRLFRSPWLKRF